MPRIGNVDVPDDVVESLSRAPKPQVGYGDILSAAAEGAYGQVRYGIPYQAGKLSGDLSAEDERFYQEGLRRTGDAAAAAAPAGVDDLTSGRVGLGRFIGQNVVASLPYMVGAGVGAGAGFLAGGPGGAVAGGIAGGIPQFSGSNVARAVEEEGGLSEQAAERALAVAPAQSSADFLLARFLPGAGKVLGTAAATQSGGFVRRTAQSIAKAGATEAVTEAAQQVGERYAAGLPTGDADAAAEYVNAAVTAFAVGGALGAGGGFRRGPTRIKPADMVTDNDLIADIDRALSGADRVTPPGIEEQIQLPLAGGSATEVQPELLAQPPETREVQPSELPQLPGLDPALSTVPADTQLELGQRFEDNLTPTDLPLPGGVQVGPQAEEALRSVANAQTPPLTASTSLSSGQVPGAQATPSFDLPEQRVFKEASLDELNEAVRAKDASQEIKAAAQSEITARRREAAGLEPLTTDDFQTRVDELKVGLRGGFVQKLSAADPKELLGKVYDEVFENANTQANVQKFAQRVGLLDENLEPTELAVSIEQDRAAAQQSELARAAEAAPTTPVATATAAPEAPAQSVASVGSDPAAREQVVQAMKAAGIQRMPAAQGLNSPADVFRALADDPKAAKRAGEATQIEKLARQLGLITNDDAMDVTPLGRQTFLSTPEGLEETVTASRDQGFTGKQASVFDRGVRAQIAGEAPAAFSDFGDMAAYEAGKVWAKNYIEAGATKTAAQTEAIRARQGARRTGVATDRETIDRRELTPDQVQKQALNRLIDAADLRAVSDSDQSALRRMVRDGATPDEVGRALQQVQGGQTLFREGPRTPSTPTTVTSDGRGQPIFKEMAGASRDPQKIQQRAESEAAVEAYNLRGLIQFAQAENAITDARAQKLQTMLDEGKVPEVKRAMKAFDPDATPQARKARATVRSAKAFDVGKWGSLIGDTDPAFERAVTGKSFLEVAQHMIENAPSKYHQEVMLKVRTMAQMMERQGMTFDFRVVKPGDQVPTAMNEAGTKALTHVRYSPQPSAVVYVNGSEMGPDGVLNYQVAAHEMLHATTMLLTAYGNNPEIYGKTKLGKAVAALYDLQSAIADHFNARAESGSLNDFEQRFYDRDNNSLSDVDEILVWGLTNPEMQRYLNSIEYKPRQSVFSRLVQLVRGILGLEPRHDGVLAELLRVSEQVFTVPRAELEALLPRNNPDSGRVVFKSAAISEGGASAENRTVQVANQTTESVARMATQVADSINLQDVGVKARRTVLGWLSHNQLDRQYGRVMPGLVKHSDAKRQQAAVRGRWAQMGVEAYQAFEKLERDNPKAAERVGKLMATATEFRLDPDKTWEQHEHLQNDPNADKLKRLHGDAVKLANDLRRGDAAGWKMYNHFRALNEAQNFARMAAGLHERIATDPELALGVENATVNPVDAFMRAEGVATPEAIRDYWQKALNDQITSAAAFVQQKKGEAAQGTASDQQAMRQHLSPIELQISAIHEAIAGMAKSPYFHLGRFGDHFGSAVIRKTKEGVADPAAVEHVAQALEAAGFGDAQISTDNTRPRFSLRFETVDQTRRFRALMEDLKEQGWLDAEETIKSGPRTQEGNFGTAEGLPDYVQRYIQAIEASPMYQPSDGMSAKERGALAQARQQAVQLAVDTWVEQQPDTSISKVLVKRYTVPGYNKDMVRNFAHRWNVGSINIANISAAPKFNSAFVEMRAQANEALETSEGNEYVLNDLLREVKIRDATNPVNETADTFDKLRAVGHAYFLGFSPAYGVINMTQLGVVALPELAKQHGYAKSFHAMRRASTKALAIMKVANEEARQLGPKHWADLTLTENTLKKAGLTDAERSFANHMVASGTIDIGSAARAFGQITDANPNSRLEIGLKYASAIGLYTESFSRLTTALAAQELHKGDLKSAEKYATNVVSNSMFDYQNWNTARQLGKQGFAGPVTPLLTQFMSYSVQVTEKLYSEAMDAFVSARPGESAAQVAQRKAASRRFLFGHLTAVTALAGTLGLPFASVFAAVLERVVDKFDDDEDPFDATAAWRNFLADVFGEDVAEVVARGVPRAFGFDISQRAGEADLLPFSQLLSDRRSWKESVEGYLGRSIGASPNMLLNVAEGGSQFADGNWLEGAKTFMPVALKGPIEAYRLTQDGYVDSRGTRLPMSPGASAIMWQLIGFSPAERAEYSEARRDQQARRGLISRQAGQLRQGIIKAMRDGDQERARELISEAQKFDQDNPSFSVLGGLMESARRQQQVRTRAQQLRAPMGVSMQDIAGQQLTDYANVNYVR